MLTLTTYLEITMHHVNVEREINSDVNAVWAVLDDFSAIHKYNPGVKSSEIVSRQKNGLGVQRICHFYDGSSLKETITDYKPKEGYAFELSEFSMPLKTASTRFSVRPLSADRCTVSVNLSFVPKFGFLGWLMAKLMMRPMLTKALTGLTKGLDDHLRTGQIVLQDGSLHG